MRHSSSATTVMGRQLHVGRNAPVSTMTDPWEPEVQSGPGPHEERRRIMTDTIKIVPCLWFNKNAEEAAKFYAATFPNSRVIAVHKSPTDYPDGKAGDVLTVDFTVLGQRFVGLNGGPAFTFDEAISFQVITDTHDETHPSSNAIAA